MLFVVVVESGFSEWEGEGGSEGAWNAFVEKGFSSRDFDVVTDREDADKGGETKADTILCETSDKRIEARF